MLTNRHGAIARPALVVTLLAVLGTPLVAYLWETLNQILAGRLALGRIAVSLPLLLVFLGLLVAAGRALSRLAAAPGAEPAPGAAEEPEVAGTLFLTTLLLMLVFGAWVIMYVLLLDR